MLKRLACLDSPEMAASRQRELDVPRKLAAALGRSAVQAVQQGYYRCGTVKVDWSPQVQAACLAKVSIPPEASLPEHNSAPETETQVQVANETTLAAARRLVAAGWRPLALNFANGVCPGGGFTLGSRAQEEVLCRCSALYRTLLDDPMYDAHRQRPRPDSTDWAIYSPDVPVFRTDDGTELEHPWLLSFLTCAAPVAHVIGQPQAGDLLQQRIRRVLAIARAYEHRAVVLGAWGCGSFRNDPHRAALDFCNALENEFQGAFAQVVFAITDWSPERKFLGPFREVFAPETE